MKSYGGITRSYRREREVIGERERERVIMKSYRREREGAGTIGLD